MKSNYQSTPIEHLENRWPKCKMHTQERQLTHFFVIFNWSTKTEPTVFQNRTVLEKSIPHIPSDLSVISLLSKPSSNSATCVISIAWYSKCLYTTSVYPVIVSFPLVETPDVNMIAWTTTPWTLPSNVALCVHPDLDYVKIKGWQKCTVVTVMKFAVFVCV